MAKSRRATLKVFRARLGFFETVVAAPSQAAALLAWGVRQNLFAEGQAAVSSLDTANRAALAHPGEVLRRPVGTNAAFEIQPQGLPTAPRGSRETKAARKTARPPSKPDRQRIVQAQAKLDELDAARRREESRFEKRQSALDDEMARSKAKYVERRKTATEALAIAEQAYNAAAGRDS